MSKKVNLQFRRFEFKYHIPINYAERLIPELLNFMEWDEYTQDEDYYNVYSIYYDSQNFKCYHEKVDGLLNRKKVRIRTYDHENTDNTPFFLEIKRKSGEIILKDRIIINQTDYQDFLEDNFSLLKKNYNPAFINEFLYEISNSIMTPRIITKYKRKAFHSKFDKKFRVTLDYDLQVAKPTKSGLKGATYKNTFEDWVVLEMKFNGAMPKWFHKVIDEYKLTKQSFSKFCSGIDECYGIPSFF